MKDPRRLLIVIVLFFYSLPLVSGQTNSAGSESIPLFGLELKSSYGFIINHRPALKPLQDEHSQSFDISFVSTSKGKHSWEKDFLFPDRGIQIAAFRLGSPEELGWGFVAYPFIDFPLHGFKKWQWHLRYGIGLGYIEKIFHPQENQKNAAISAHWNGVIHFDLHGKTYLKKNTALNLGAGITHYSNGSTGIPNLGINLAIAHIGILHYFGETKRNKIFESAQATPNGEWSAYMAAATKKIYPPGGKRYQAATVSALHLRRLSGRTSLGIGTDVFFDNSLEERFRRENNTETDRSVNFRPGIHAAWQVKTGNIGLMFNLGIYPYTKWKGDGNFYHRICLRYYMEKMFLCMNLKTHYARADFVEWGIGYRFN